jgi:hypothetical protein
MAQSSVLMNQASRVSRIEARGAASTILRCAAQRMTRRMISRFDISNRISRNLSLAPASGWTAGCKDETKD